MSESSCIKQLKRPLEDVDRDQGSPNEKSKRSDAALQPPALESSHQPSAAGAVELTCLGDQDRPLTEVHLGITQYVGKLEGFKGVIKQRYSDFMVTEVDLQSRLTTLDNVNLPKEEHNLPDVDTVLDKATLENLQLLAACDDAPSVIIEVENMSKERRRLIHELLRNCYSNFVSNTEDQNGTKVIIVTRSKGNNGGRLKFQKGVRSNWPAYRGNYTHFTLYKENIDTMEAINLIAKLIGMKAGSFAYAGVKDKRAKTLQRVSVYRVEAIKLLKLNEKLRRMMIGNVGYFKEPIKLGDLSGNQFRIALRNVEGSWESITKSLSSLREIGFINYYGMQRFGTTCVPTYAIGLALLKCDWKLAVEFILKPRPGDNENMAQARKLWMDTRDPTKALTTLSHRNSNEAHLLRGLEAHGTTDLVNALNFIPRNMRLMYVHSYQSYVWNHVVSKRIAKYGLSTVEGDLIIKDALPSETKDEDINDVKQEGKIRIVPTILKNEMCSIYDVVLPLFGYDVLYPNNEIQKWYREILSDVDLDVDNIRHKIKTYSLSGSYRRMVVRPRELTWSSAQYNDANKPLFISDYENLTGHTDFMTPEAQSETEGKSEAVKLEFTLPSSSYATMALREILRADTSASFQSTLNQI